MRMNDTSMRGGVAPQQRRAVQPRQMGDAGDVIGILRGLAAEVRRLGERVQALEQSARVLDQNDRRLSGYVESEIGQVNQKMMVVAKRLLSAAGRGAQTQQLVPLAQEHDYPIYNTPPRGQVSAQVARMMTQPGPAASEEADTELVQDDTTPDEALFYAGEEAEDDDD